MSGPCRSNRKASSNLSWAGRRMIKINRFTIFKKTCQTSKRSTLRVIRKAHPRRTRKLRRHRIHSFLRTLRLQYILSKRITRRYIDFKCNKMMRSLMRPVSQFKKSSNSKLRRERQEADPSLYRTVILSFWRSKPASSKCVMCCTSRRSRDQMTPQIDHSTNTTMQS